VPDTGACLLAEATGEMSTRERYVTSLREHPSDVLFFDQVSIHVAHVRLALGVTVSRP
jgi:hypothetical protein